jgi:hypothetical protein
MTARDFLFNMGTKNSCFASPSQVIISSPSKTGINVSQQLGRLTTITKSTITEEKCLLSSNTNDYSSTSFSIFNLVGKEVL